MALVDRGVRRLLRHLDDNEAVVASLTGVESDGRRRRLVIVTERRILVGWVRGDPPLELNLDGAKCRYDDQGALLTLEQGEHEMVLRSVDELAGRALADLVANHRSAAATAASRSSPAMRIVAS